MAILPPQIYLQILDENGNPLIGGTFETYLAGSNTPIATYTDVSQTVENPEVMTIPANGIIRYWLDPALVYKIIIKRRNGSIYYAIDNVQGSVTEASGLVKVSDSDTGNGYLGDKIEAGANISVDIETEVGGNQKIVISASGSAINDLQGAYDDGDGSITLLNDKPFKLTSDALTGDYTTDNDEDLFKIALVEGTGGYEIKRYAVLHDHNDSAFYYRTLNDSSTEIWDSMSKGGLHRTALGSGDEPLTSNVTRKLSDINWGLYGYRMNADASAREGGFRLEGGANGTTLELWHLPETVEARMYKYVGTNQISETNEVNGSDTQRYTYMNQSYWNDTVSRLPNNAERIENLNGDSQAYTLYVKVGTNDSEQTSFYTSGYNYNYTQNGTIRKNTSIGVAHSFDTVYYDPTSYCQRKIELVGGIYKTATFEAISNTDTKAFMTATNGLTSEVAAESTTVRTSVIASDLGVAGAFQLFNKTTLLNDVDIKNDSASYIKTGLRTKGQIYSERYIKPWASTLNMDFNELQGNFQEVTLGGTTSIYLTNTSYGATYGILINNPSAHEVYWPGTVRWAEGIEPDLAVAGIHMVTLYATSVGGSDVFLAVAGTSFA
jgi:hypothetical protein